MKDKKVIGGKKDMKSRSEYGENDSDGEGSIREDRSVVVGGKKIH